MSESQSGSFSVETYITKQEGLLFDYIRRLLQSETKVAILESAIKELYKKNEDLEKQVVSCNDTINQSVNGLQAVTLERDRATKRVEELEVSLRTVQSERDDTINHLRIEQNNVAVLNGTVNEMNEKLQVAQDDYSTVKENYIKVLAALESANEKLAAIEAQDAVVLNKNKKRVKKVQETESGWVDGEYKIST